MKRICAFFLLCLLLLSGCSRPAALAYLDAPLAGIIEPACLPDVYPLLSADMLAAAIAEKELDSLRYTAETSVADAVTHALNDGCNLLIVGLASSADAQQVLAIAKPKGAPVIFYGAAPASALLQGYDKAWYVGANPAKQGEVLGEALVADAKNGLISDKNQDHLVQYAVIGSAADNDVRAEATMRVFENYGLFSANLGYRQTPADNEQAAYDAAYQLIAEMGDQTELLLCANSLIATGAARAYADAGLSIAIGYYDNTDATLPDGSIILAGSCYDAATAARLLSDFAYNVGHRLSITDGTGVYLDQNSSVQVSFTAQLPAAATLNTETGELNG